VITIKEFMELIDYKITEGRDYLWNCYGNNSFQLVVGMIFMVRVVIVLTLSSILKIKRYMKLKYVIIPMIVLIV